MNKFCKECGKQLLSQTESNYCEDCDDALDEKFYKTQEEIIENRDINNEQIDFLKRFERDEIIDLYSEVYNTFALKIGLGKKEQNLLLKFKLSFNISDSEIETYIYKLNPKKDREIIIKFLDKIPRSDETERAIYNNDFYALINNNREKQIYVYYSGINLDIRIIAKDFFGYFKKIVFNLSKQSKPGYFLNININYLINNGISRNTEIIRKHRSDFTIRLVEDHNRPHKIYSSRLFSHPFMPYSLTNLKLTWIGENTYAPLSVFVFLLFLQKNLDRNRLTELIDCLNYIPDNDLEYYEGTIIQ